jgi:hypothetical protein
MVILSSNEAIADVHYIPFICINYLPSIPAKEEKEESNFIKKRQLRHIVMQLRNDF